MQPQEAGFVNHINNNTSERSQDRHSNVTGLEPGHRRLVSSWGHIPQLDFSWYMPCRSWGKTAGHAHRPIPCSSETGRLDLPNTPASLYGDFIFIFLQHLNLQPPPGFHIMNLCVPKNTPDLIGEGFSRRILSKHAYLAKSFLCLLSWR